MRAESFNKVRLDAELERWAGRVSAQRQGLTRFCPPTATFSFYATSPMSLEWPPVDWSLDGEFDFDFAFASSGVSVDPFSPLAHLFLPLSPPAPLQHLHTPLPAELRSPAIALPLPPLKRPRQSLPVATYGVTDTPSYSRKRVRTEHDTDGREQALDVGEDGAEPPAISGARRVNSVERGPGC